MRTALIGLGAIGAPIAHKLYTTYGNNFFLIANSEIKKELLQDKIYINGDLFEAAIQTKEETEINSVDLLFVCIKNYSLKSSLCDIIPFVGKKTIILPLQNGIYSYRYFKEMFPNNLVLQGYAQGPNTEIIDGGFKYSNSGELHIGSETDQMSARLVSEYLKKAGMPTYYEDEINRAVWKKWMLNVAGNSITALTGADYSLFRIQSNLQTICRQAMQEFTKIAEAENVRLTEDDIEDIMKYYVSYTGGKKTSMLMDVINERRTENAYLAGTVLELGEKHGIPLPIISTLYYLIEVKENVYMAKKGCNIMDGLYGEGVEYSDALRNQMNDVCQKLTEGGYAKLICNGKMPEQLCYILKYATENTEFYSKYKNATKLSEFPVMNKTLLNKNYDAIQVHAYDNIKTHKMHTSGSTGIPFTVVQDLAKRERHIADLKYFGALAGYTDHDPMCYLRAKPTATPEEQERDNIFQLDICNLNERNLTDYYHIMVEKKCTALIAYPSTLETAVDVWGKRFVNESSVRTIISTSETLTDEVREKLRNFFGENVGIYARYSNTEQGILGQETGESGRYSLNWASYYFEVLKMDEDLPADEGELGRVVVTDLYNKAFPMIRYDTGDVAKMEKGKKGDFPEFSELYGRRMDLIYDLKGEVVSPFLLCRTMRLASGIEQWQFIQETRDCYTILITANTDKKPRLDKEIKGFKDVLGEDAIINVEYVEAIPVMNSLKRKLIVSKLKNN